jgi:hypothetical protein
MPNEKMIAALPLAALFAALCHMPPASAQESGMVVVRDPQTGQLRAPTAAELQALRKPPTAALQAQQKPALVTHPDGTRQLRIGEQGMVYSVVSRGADGKLVEQCVQGSGAANTALEKANPVEEHSHETR